MSYKKGIIYRIEHKSRPEIRYIGSTFNELRHRWQTHKGAYKEWIKGKQTTAICPYFEQYGIENFFIKAILVKDFCDREHLKAYEQLYINRFKCVNIHSAFRIDYLYYKQYYEERKEEINNNRKQYTEEHKDEISQSKRQYYEKNKNEISQRKRQYYEKNKNEINQKVECSVCKCLVIKKGLSRHNKTKKHQDNLERINLTTQSEPLSI